MILAKCIVLYFLNRFLYCCDPLLWFVDGDAYISWFEDFYVEHSLAVVSYSFLAADCTAIMHIFAEDNVEATPFTCFYVLVFIFAICTNYTDSSICSCMNALDQLLVH